MNKAYIVLFGEDDLGSIFEKIVGVYTTHQAAIDHVVKGIANDTTPDLWQEIEQNHLWNDDAGINTYRIQVEDLRVAVI